ncbi:MAG: DUF4352 domain-containing protein [Streptococcaceae bacterium]|jgi:hypothetical protein|nr:DUF4352 domain-containing protein [Streptococcaceae bacterium]
MKLIKILTAGAVSAAALFALTGCFGASKTATIKIDSQNVVISDEKKADNGNVFVDIVLEVTNNTKSTFKDFTSYNLSLYDSKNNVISSTNLFSSHGSALNSFSKTSDLQAGKTIKGDIVFQVSKGQKYTLHYTPVDSNFKKLKDVEIEVDTSKVTDNSSNLKTMVGDYINAVFFGKTNVKSNLKNDLNSEAAKFKTDFAKGVASHFKDINITASASDAQSFVESYMKTNASKSKSTLTIKEMVSDYAIVTIKPQTIDLADLDLSTEKSAEINNWEKANAGKYDDSDKMMAALSKYILSIMPTEIAKLSAKDPTIYMPTDGYQMVFKKGTDGEWTFDSQVRIGNDDFSSLQQVYSSYIVGQ